MGAAYRGEGYYVCARRLRVRDCANGYMAVPAVDAEVRALVLARLGELRGELGKGAPPPVEVPTARDHAKARRAVAARRERLVDALESGALDAATFRVRIARLDVDLGRIEVDAAADERASVVVLPRQRREMLEQVRVLARVWDRAPVADRRAIATQLASRIELRSGTSPVLSWRNLVELAEELCVKE